MLFAQILLVIVDHTTKQQQYWCNKLKIWVVDGLDECGGR